MVRSRMSRQSDLAFAHQRRREALAHDLAGRLIRLWRQVPLHAMDSGWGAVAPLMQRQVIAAQTVAAEQAIPYLAAVDRSYGFKPAPAILAMPAFTNVMGDGREVMPALFGAVTNTKQLIGGGLAPARAFESGASFIAIIAQAALHDMGRNADRVLAAGKGYTRYVRVVNGAACSRCAILAGIYSGPDAFKRHTGCQCGAVPVPEGKGAPRGLHDSPEAYFNSLTRAEQDRVFTNAGAEAIRQGADPVKVVNARRGAYGIGYSGHGGPTSVAGANRLQKVTIGVRADGTPLQVYATTEGTTARGAWAKATKSGSLRLMPENIAVMAGNDPARWAKLLQRYGYLD